MACTLKGELKCKDGRRNTFTVQAENNLKSIIEGVKKINAEISVVLTEFVQEEKRLNTESGQTDEEEEEDEEDDKSATQTDAVTLKYEHPAKRLKTSTES